MIYYILYTLRSWFLIAIRQTQLDAQIWQLHKWGGSHLDVISFTGEMQIWVLLCWQKRKYLEITNLSCFALFFLFIFASKAFSHWNPKSFFWSMHFIWTFVLSKLDFSAKPSIAFTAQKFAEGKRSTDSSAATLPDSHTSSSRSRNCLFFYMPPSCWPVSPHSDSSRNNMNLSSFTHKTLLFWNAWWMKSRISPLKCLI